MAWRPINEVALLPGTVYMYYPMAGLVQPLMFHGEANDDPTAYLSALDRFFTAYAVHPDDQLEVIESTLGGNAAKWWSPYSNLVRETFEFTERFIEKYDVLEMVPTTEPPIEIIQETRNNNCEIVHKTDLVQNEETPVKRKRRRKKAVANKIEETQTAADDTSQTSFGTSEGSVTTGGEDRPEATAVSETEHPQPCAEISQQASAESGSEALPLREATACAAFEEVEEIIEEIANLEQAPKLRFVQPQVLLEPKEDTTCIQSRNPEDHEAFVYPGEGHIQIALTVEISPAVVTAPTTSTITDADWADELPPAFYHLRSKNAATGQPPAQLLLHHDVHHPGDLAIDNSRLEVNPENAVLRRQRVEEDADNPPPPVDDIPNRGRPPEPRTTPQRHHVIK